MPIRGLRERGLESDLSLVKLGGMGWDGWRIKDNGVI